MAGVIPDAQSKVTVTFVPETVVVATPPSVRFVVPATKGTVTPPIISFSCEPSVTFETVSTT